MTPRLNEEEDSPIRVYLTDNRLKPTHIFAAEDSADGSLARALQGNPELEAMQRRVLGTAKGERRRLSAGNGDAQRVFDVTVEPLAIRAGFLEGLCVCILDITDLVRTERRARSAEDHVENLLAISGAVIVVLGADGDVRSINRRGCELLGRGVDAVVGLDWIETFIPERHRRELRKVFDAVLDGDPRPSGYHENPVIGAGGQERLVAWRSTILRDAAGRFAGILSTGEDITETRRTRDALDASEARFRATFENAAVGIAHIDLDGGWLRINRRLCAILGYGRDELIGLRFHDVTHPEDGWTDADNTRRLIAGEVADFATEKRCVRKDGSLVWVRLTASLVRTADGAPEYLITIVDDITSRRESDEKVRELAAVVENSSDFTALAEPDGTILYLNRAGHALVGLPEGERIRTNHMEEYLVAEDRGFWREGVLPAVIGDGQWAGEFRLYHLATGDPVPVHCSMHRISDSSTGRPLRLVIVACDMRAERPSPWALRITSTG